MADLKNGSRVGGQPIESQPGAQAKVDKALVDAKSYTDAHINAGGLAHPTATTSQHGFLSSTDKTKLDGVATGATKVEDSTTNGNIKINGSENVVYTHPTNHPPSIITQDASNRFVTDTEKATWNGKLDSTANAVSASKLATARTISLAGDVTGSVSFDGTANVSITTTVADDSHNHIISNIDGLQTALDGKAATTHNHDTVYVNKTGDTMSGLLTFGAGQSLAPDATSGAANTQGIRFAADSDQFDIFMREDNVGEKTGLVIQMADNPDDYFLIEQESPSVEATPAMLFKISESAGATFGGNVAIGGSLDMGNDPISGVTTLSGQYGTIAKSTDEWLRINDDASHTSGTYFGSTIVRTDGTLQVGPSGGTFNASSGSFTYNGNNIWHAGNFDPSTKANSSHTHTWSQVTGVPSASTSAQGIVQLNDTVTSTSTTLAATANAVKQVQDYASQIGVVKTVQLATTANIDLAVGGLLTIDGVVTAAGNRVLVKNQTTTSQNGIYVVATGAWTRATDHDSAVEIQTSTIVVENGTANMDTVWNCTTTGTITVGTTGLSFTKFAIREVEASTGLTRTGSNKLSVNFAGNGAATTAARSDHTHTFNGLSDVTLTSPATNHVLQYSGTAWVNKTLSSAGIAAASHSHDGSYVNIGGDSMTGKLSINGNSISTSATDGILQVGSSTGTHLLMDGNQIEARNGTGGGTLYLNNFGSPVTVGGILTNANPSWRVDAGTGAATIPTASDYRVPFNYAGTAVVNGVFTAPYTGTYQINASIYHNLYNGQNIQLKLVVNDSVKYVIDKWANTSTILIDGNLKCNVIYALAAGDRVQFNIYASGANNTINFDHSVFSAMLIG